MKDSLITELYTPSECTVIRELCLEEDVKIKNLIKEAIGNKIILSQETILTSKPIDILFLICLNAKFATSEDECHRVAMTLYQYYNKPHNIIPLISEDIGLVLANKVLVSLSFYAEALNKRWKYHGAPSPDFYRTVSVTIFNRNGQKDIAEHHKKWESFLGELFV